MARIYNFMGFDIKVVGDDGGPTIANGQRSDSLEWKHTDGLSVSNASTGAVVCYFNFGEQADIQGGNYAIISPGSFHVYNSNHDVINTGAEFEGPGGALS